jgi:hypothetical protein
VGPSMGELAYLHPVGPFTGLSDTARHQIGSRFPTLSFGDIESAAERFLKELEVPGTEPRLAEARDELNSFGSELARFQSALDGVRKHQLDGAIGEASRIICGENEFENLQRSLNNVRTAFQRTSRALPAERSEIASRKLVVALARHMKDAGLPLTGSVPRSLVSLVDLIFDDLMIGGDANAAVAEWQKGQAADVSRDALGMLIDLVVG